MEADNWGKGKGTFFVFDETGDLAIIHDGNFDLKSLVGELIRSEKCTEVDWDPFEGVWFSELRDGRRLSANINREVVVEEEHIIISDMVAVGKRIPRNNFLSTFIRDCRRLGRKVRRKLKS